MTVCIIHYTGIIIDFNGKKLLDFIFVCYFYRVLYAGSIITGYHANKNNSYSY